MLNGLVLKSATVAENDDTKVVAATEKVELGVSKFATVAENSVHWGSSMGAWIETPNLGNLKTVFSESPYDRGFLNRCVEWGDPQSLILRGIE
jgi:hypothetical protein